MKKLMFSALAFATCSLPVLAAEGDLVQVSDVSEIFTTAKTNMGALIDAALPVVIAFVGGGLVIWGALALVSLLKRGLSAGKGR